MSLKSLVGQRIINDVIKSVKKPGEWKVLIVDQLAMRVISACCKMHEIMMEGVTIVEDLHKGRQSLPLEAIYFVTPSEKTIDAMLDDFKEPSNFRYSAAHIFFTETCSPTLFQNLASPKSHLGKRIKTIKEVNIAFMPVEAQVFSLDSADSFYQLYSPKTLGDEKMKTVESIAEQLATVCATLGEYPSVRYRSGTSLCCDVAQAVLRKLDAYKADDPSMGDGPNKQQSQLLILDRGFDTVSPLLHELTFQAMAYDLLDIQNDVYRYEEKSGGEYQQKEVLLDDSDELWKKMRHKHIANVSKDITAEFKAFSERKKVGMRQDREKTTIRDLHLMIKKMPQYQKELNQYGVYLHLADEAMTFYKQNQIEKLCAVEQDLATGIDKDGEKIRDPMRSIVPVLLDKEIAEYNKLRIILLLATVMQGITDENMSKLMEHAKISSVERSTILNMAHLGVTIIQDSGKKKPLPQRKERNEETYQLSRYVPYMQDIMEDILEGKLDTKFYPFLMTREMSGGGSSGVTSARRGGHLGNWHKDKGQTDAKSGPRLIVFVLGGVCYSEIRCAYQVTETFKDSQKNWEVLIGGTELLTPETLLVRLRGL